MSNRTDLIYRYDGTFDGLMCCIFESYYKKEIPSEIFSPENEQITFYDTKEILTDEEKANRVKNSIPKKISAEAFYDIKKCFLSCHPQKEMLILKFVYLGFKYGKRACGMLAHEFVNEFFKTSQNVGREAHFYKEFLRFSEYNGVLVSIIEPKCIVLPLIQRHYCERLNTESFFIFDKNHNMALTYSNKKAEIIPAEEISLPLLMREKSIIVTFGKPFIILLQLKNDITQNAE